MLCSLKLNDASDHFLVRTGTTDTDIYERVIRQDRSVTIFLSTFSSSHSFIYLFLFLPLWWSDRCAQQSASLLLLPSLLDAVDLLEEEEEEEEGEEDGTPILD